MNKYIYIYEFIFICIDIRIFLVAKGSTRAGLEFPHIGPRRAGIGPPRAQEHCIC